MNDTSEENAPEVQGQAERPAPAAWRRSGGRTTAPRSRVWESVSSLGEAHRYLAGPELFPEGAPPQEVFFLLSGFVKLVVSAGWQAIVSLCADSVLGTGAALLRTPHCATAIALANCRLKRAGAAQFRRLLVVEPAFSRRVSEAHGPEIVQLSPLARGCEDSTRRTAPGAALARPGGHASGQPRVQWRVSLPLKLYELAHLLAITPPYLSRLLAKLEADGVFRREQGGLILHCT